MRRVLIALSFGSMAALGLSAQAPVAPADAPADMPVDEAVDDERLLQRIEDGCARLRAAGELRTIAQLRDGADGRRGAFEPAPRRSVPLPPEQLRALLLRSALIVGHYYHCDECDDWHFTASSGFALANDGVVATCFHLLLDDADPDAPDELLAVADWRGHVFPVTAVLAADRGSDVAVLQCTARDLVPLPLRPDVGVGERVYCLGNPDHMFATFGDGLVARRYVVHGPAPGIAPLPAAHGRAGAGESGTQGRVFLQVTCEIAVGSSGAPITDACGNLVAIAQSTATVFTDAVDGADAEPQMVVRTATPATALQSLRR